MSDNFLSPELLKELSDGRTEELLCTTLKRKRSKGSTGQEKESPELMPMSKSARKKQEQLQLKKVKESKRAMYFRQISDNSISDNQRKLLICTKDMGQAGSKRKKANRSLAKERAGIPLNTSEMDVLFAKSTNDCDSSQAYPDVESAECGEEEVVRTKAFLPRDNKSTDASTGATEKVPSLLQQFEDIKAGRGSLIAQDMSPSQIEKIDDVKKTGFSSETSVISAERNPHHPVETVIPISERGKVTSMAQKGSGGGRAVASSGALFLKRDPLMQESRMQLPICGMEQEIVEAISSNDVIILCGETGSGKSTQVPQFLYENGFSSSGLIGITQPRRVAVTSTASRVAVEMGCPFDAEKGTAASVKRQNDNLVGFQIRHDSSTLNSNMKIKFMTDGILLKEVSSNILLKKYNVVILDEAHERNVNTDVLLGMLSRAIPLRRRQHEAEMSEWLKIPADERAAFEEPIRPLRLVIMSATLRVDDFLTTRLFSVMPPVLKVEARQFSVKTHFSKRTETDNFLDEAFHKVCQIHQKLPSGGILLFLTGKREINYMCRRLSNELNSYNSTTAQWNDDDDAEEESEGLLGSDDKEAIADKLFQDKENVDFEMAVERDISNKLEAQNIVTTERVDVGKYSDGADEEGGGDDCVRRSFLKEALGGNNASIDDSHNETVEKPSHATEGGKGTSTVPPPLAAVVLPLYAMLSADRQKKVFEEVPEGHRLIVVSTNVAETSITIPGVRYVVDCGRQKERIIDVQSGISKYKVTWISQASANQRTGRAGRTGPGHCYRLYSSSFFNQHMVDFQEPEICTFPLEDLVLQLRSIGIKNVSKFPFPTPPPMQSLVRAETLLTNLGAIHVKTSTFDGKSLSALESISSILDTEKARGVTWGGITSLGKNIAKFPINARLGKMLIVAHKAGNVPMGLAISVVATLTERSIFCTPTFSSANENDDEYKFNGEDDDDIDADSSASDALRMHPTSDVLARVRAFGAFSYFTKTYKSTKGVSAENAALSFCNSRGLHHPTISRCLHLFKQLCQICHVFLNRVSVGDKENFEDLPPPSEVQETALRQIMLTGFSDSIARRVPTGSSIFTDQCSKRKKLTAYLSCDPAVTTPLFIHPQSTLFRKDPMAPLPEFVIYTELLMSEDGDTTYMSGVSQISPGWISELTKDCPLLQWSPPLKYPSPHYDRKSDSIMCFASSTYGVHKWELPVGEYEMLSLCRLSDACMAAAHGKRSSDEVYRWFGRFLLEGKVISSNCEIGDILRRSNMLESPAVITDVKSNKKVEILIKLLVKCRVHSLRALRSQIKVKRSFLVNEVQPFLKEKARKQLVASWGKNAKNI